VVNLTIGSSWTASRVRDWKVEDIETLSDHMYITFSMEIGFDTSCDRARRIGWNTSKFDKEIQEVIDFRLACLDLLAITNTSSRVIWLMATIVMACDCSAQGIGGRGNRRDSGRVRR